MADVTTQLRRTSVSWYIALPEAFADRAAPTSAEFAGPLVWDISCAVDEDGTTFQLTDSDTDDRYSYCTESGLDTPTNFNPEVELGFYRDADRAATGAFADAFNLLHSPDIPLYVIKRVGDQDNAPGVAVAADDIISMQYIRTDFGIDVVGVDDPAMMSQSGLQQGWQLWQYTLAS
jgi:hypothetical protein